MGMCLVAQHAGQDKRMIIDNVLRPCDGTGIRTALKKLVLWVRLPPGAFLNYKGGKLSESTPPDV